MQGAASLRLVAGLTCRIETLRSSTVVCVSARIHLRPSGRKKDKKASARPRGMILGRLKPGGRNALNFEIRGSTRCAYAKPSWPRIRTRLAVPYLAAHSAKQLTRACLQAGP